MAFYGIICHMKAGLIIRDRRIFGDGCLMEIIVWEVPAPVPPGGHKLKYRLYYGRKGERIVGYAMSAARAITATTASVRSLTGFRRWNSCSMISSAMSRLNEEMQYEQT